MLAKINIACQFANNFEITIVNALASQRRNGAQRRTQPDRPHINVQAQRLAKAQQASSRALSERQPTPRRPADRAQQTRVARAAAGQRLGRQRRAKALDGGSAKSEFAKLEFVFERFRAVLQDLYRGMRYFGPDSIAR